MNRLMVVGALFWLSCGVDQGPEPGADPGGDRSELLGLDWAKALPSVLACDTVALGQPCRALYGTVGQLNTVSWCTSYGCWTLDDQVSSVQVGSGLTAMLCEQSWFGGPCRTFEANASGGYYPLNWYWFDGTYRVMDNAASSIEIRQKAWDDTFTWSWFNPNHPHDRNNFWSKDAQGIAHDSNNNWVVTKKEAIFRLPVSWDLAGNSFERSNTLPDLCQHFGDPDVYAGEVFVPLEGCPTSPGTANRIYVYDSELQKKRVGHLPTHSNGAWAAVNPTNGLLYSAPGFSWVDKISVYSRNFRDGAWLVPLYDVWLDVPMPRVQGGAFSASGHLYLVVDDQSPTGRPGVHVFSVKGRTAKWERYLGVNGYISGAGEELEGITIWDVDPIPGKHPSVSGQIHFVLIDWDFWTGYDLYGKHIGVDDPSKL